MADSHNCQRCSLEETIIHQTVTCPYVREIWDLATKVTGSLNIDLSSILGVNQNHSKTTFTLNLEIIKQLLAIERPTIEPKILIECTITRLAYHERGVSSLEMNQLLSQLKLIT